jgi:C-terminal domain 9 of the ABC-three component (ABC-3C) systems
MSLITSSGVNQTGASASGNIAGRDVNTTVVNVASQAAGIVEQLLQKLKIEKDQDQTSMERIERLQRFYIQRAHDGVNGLEAKLAHCGRQDSYLDAIEMKEMFAKLLEKWSLYFSAQQIFVYLLARAERHFNDIILPQIPDLSPVQVNQLMNRLIVEPTVQDCGASVFEIDHNVAMGMIYWLAEQCFVRWHK